MGDDSTKRILDDLALTLGGTPRAVKQLLERVELLEKAQRQHAKYLIELDMRLKKLER